MDEDEAIVEDVEHEDDLKIKVGEEVAPKLKTVTSEEWVHLNQHPPLWTRYASLSEGVVCEAYVFLPGIPRTSLTRNTKISTGRRSRT